MSGPLDWLKGIGESVGLRNYPAVTELLDQAKHLSYRYQNKNGPPDSNGNCYLPKVKLDASGNATLDAQGNLVFEVDAQGKIVYDMLVNAKQYVAFIYTQNAEGYKSRLKFYEHIKGEYETQIKAVKEELRKSVKLANDDFQKQKAFDERIKMMWQNYNDEYRDAKHTAPAQRYKAKILALQKTRPSVEKIDTYKIKQFYQYDYDLNQLAAYLTGTVPASTTTIITINGEDLIETYEGKIKDIEDNYMPPIQYEVDKNLFWAKKSLE